MGTPSAEFASKVGVHPRQRTTVIYLTHISEAWEINKNYFFRDADIKAVPDQDDKFVSHLLFIHSKFCDEPWCSQILTGSPEDEVKVEDHENCQAREDKIQVDTKMMHGPTSAEHQNIVCNVRFATAEKICNSNQPSVPPESADVKPCFESISSGEGNSSMMGVNRSLQGEPASNRDEVGTVSRGDDVHQASHDETDETEEFVAVRIKIEPDEEPESPEPTDEMVETMPSSSQSAPGLSTQSDQEGVSGPPPVFHHTKTQKSRLECDRMQTGVKYHCEKCPKSLERKFLLERHTNVHIGQKLYQCDVCSQFFPEISVLNIHKKIHTIEKPFPCGVCSKSFSQKHHLNNHMSTHTGEKPYQCDVCSKSFSRMHHLLAHRKIHTGEKPHQCDVCSKSFSLKHHLKLHRSIHTGEKPFQCDVCSKSFSQKWNLNAHMRTHKKPYHCEICSKSFSEMRALYAHKRTHKGEKPTIM